MSEKQTWKTYRSTAYKMTPWTKTVFIEMLSQASSILMFWGVFFVFFLCKGLSSTVVSSYVANDLVRIVLSKT